MSSRLIDSSEPNTTICCVVDRYCVYGDCVAWSQQTEMKKVDVITEEPILVNGKLKMQKFNCPQMKDFPTKFGRCLMVREEVI